MPARRHRPSQIAALTPLADGALVAVAGWLAYFTRWDSWAPPLNYISVLVLGSGLALILLPALGAYRRRGGGIHWRDTGHALPGLFLVAVLLMIAGTFTRTTAEFSRLWMAYWLVYAVAALFLFRWLASVLVALLRLDRLPTVRVLIVGEGELAHAVAEKAAQARDAHWQIVGLVSPSDGLRELEVQVTAPDSDLDEVWIAMDNAAPERQEAVIRVLRTCALRVRYVPDLSMLALLNHVPSQVAGMTLLELNASPLTGANALLKSALDKLLAALALLLLAPLFALVAIAIRLDSPGPVFFVQQRHGWDGRVIGVFKFRTMYHAPHAAQDARQARADDPRVTRVGRFLRGSSLDELPQFINVLRGEMSIVGPRPHPVALNQSYRERIDAYMQRHTVKPGITGWAQIHGLRGETDTLEKMQRRIEYDLYYIQHWSLWLDFKIMVLTVFKGWTGKNAY